MDMIRFFWMCAFWTVAALSAMAHDPGLSSMDVSVGRDRITVVLTLNEKDWAGTQIATADEVRNACVALTLNGVALTAENSEGPTPDHVQNVGCVIVFPRAGAGSLEVKSLLFDRLAFGHREFIKIHDEAGGILTEQMLQAASASCVVTLNGDAGAQTAEQSGSVFAAFLMLGVRHILTGYDHMLFLAGLLLVCTSFRQAAAVITFFTVAHSITLGLSALNIVAVSSRIVEPAVAASIAYVGLENIFRPEHSKWRGWIAFGFGLVHGLGFASILRTMGIGSGNTGIIVPLVSFNLGVELGQLAVALIVLPIIFSLRKEPAFLRLGAPGVSLVTALLGAIWFLQRTVLA